MKRIFLHGAFNNNYIQYETKGNKGKILTPILNLFCKDIKKD